MVPWVAVRPDAFHWFTFEFVKKVYYPLSKGKGA
jgi:hypothetical protein